MVPRNERRQEGQLYLMQETTWGTQEKEISSLIIFVFKNIFPWESKNLYTKDGLARSIQQGITNNFFYFFYF